ncbi:MAG: peroxiredoxin family protein [Phycisphaerae bacterium]|nr:peroxiredoxin family protein [Phycisphaerae bacterium]MDW8262122.1 peroxiredoxin family protein [Phycisphaerales bacterium]
MAPNASSRLSGIDFELIDHTGRRFRLSEELRLAPLLLVFVRGHWCPYCRRYLSKLQENHQRIRQAGARLAAISPEPPPTSAELARQLGLSFPILCDVNGVVINLFGVRNKFTAARTLMPHPAVFLIDQARMVRFGSIDRNFRKRTTIRTILQAIESLAPVERSAV